MNVVHYLVKKDDFSVRKWSESPLPEEIAEGEILLRIDKFAFTANNLSYATAGEGIGYWRLFPTEEGWGRIPVWGFADVVASRCDEVPVGERVYGFFPMSSHLIMKPSAIKSERFMDLAEWRQSLPPLYNVYERLSSETCEYKELEDEQMLFFPLFGTSFIVHDFVRENENFGAKNVVISSASSKTALGTAGLIQKDPELDVRVIGLTSPKNKEFCESLGYYDQVFAYDEIERLPENLDSVFLDHTGDPKIMDRVAARLGEHVKHGTVVGFTHNVIAGGIETEAVKRSNSAGYKLFFAPVRFAKRFQEWGAKELRRRIYEAWFSLAQDAKAWGDIRRLRGKSEVDAVFEDALQGNFRPTTLYSLSVA
ncbi:MAG: DUF2855 family protein [Deltaproteobacteria bacterium]|jgi:hypothetical protein|nr:DUF2855 family protein [Deltaproteobacteria bacterium]